MLPSLTVTIIFITKSLRKLLKVMMHDLLIVTDIAGFNKYCDYIQRQQEKSLKLGGNPILTEETLAFRDAIMVLVQMGINNIIIERDSQVSINFIIGQAQAPIQICNIIEDIRKLERNVLNIGFSYYNKHIITMTDRLGKRVHYVYQNDLYSS